MQARNIFRTELWLKRGEGLRSLFRAILLDSIH